MKKIYLISILLLFTINLNSKIVRNSIQKEHKQSHKNKVTRRSKALQYVRSRHKLANNSLAQNAINNNAKKITQSFLMPSCNEKNEFFHTVNNDYKSMHKIDEVCLNYITKNCSDYISRESRNIWRIHKIPFSKDVEEKMIQETYDHMLAYSSLQMLNEFPIEMLNDDQKMQQIIVPLEQKINALKGKNIVSPFEEKMNQIAIMHLNDVKTMVFLTLNS